MKKSARLPMILAASAIIASGVFATSSATAATNSAAQSANRAAAGTLWAKVSSNGTLLASSGIRNVNKFGRGRYNLTTDSDISSCALTGTINTSGGNDPGPGSGSILVGAVNGRTLFVRTATPSSQNPMIVDDDRPFSLVISC